MTALLLFVTLSVITGASAYLTYLVTDATITEPLRDNLLDTIRAPSQNTYADQLDDYRQHLNEALERGDGIPTEPPAPPDEPFLAKLLTCRFCAGLWVSLLVTLIARIGLISEYQPIWPGIPLQPLDLLIIPACALASAYTVGWLATQEGD